MERENGAGVLYTTAAFPKVCSARCVLVFREKIEKPNKSPIFKIKFEFIILDHIVKLSIPRILV